MAYKVGIIPAAGKAQRFGGTLKELLPLPDGRSFLRAAVHRLPVDLVVIVTNKEKIQEHAREIGGDAVYMVQRGDDIMGAIMTALDVRADRYYFTMPDTVTDTDNIPDAHFCMGYFMTDKPERFGCIVNGHVINKAAEVITPAHAWGTLTFDALVADLWRERQPQDYTTAINMAIHEFGYVLHPLNYYNDNASIQDYLELMRSHD